MSSTDHRSVPAVVVGVDGSAPSDAAVELAAREAALRHRPLRVVHAFIWSRLHVPLGPSPAGPPEGGLRYQAEQVVAAAVARARQAAPEIGVAGEIVEGSAATVLLEESRTASVVVVGDRGLGGFTGLLVGSVAVQLAAHAHAPVLVARGAARPGGPVLLGVDGSPASDPAVGFAMEEASLRQVPLLAVHAWTQPVSTGMGDMLPVVYDVAEVAAEEDRLLAEALAGWREKYPEVVVHRELRREHTRAALLGQSVGAQLAVVGTRGRGGFAGLLLGSVSQAMLHHSGCPVAVVGRQPEVPD